MPTIHFETKAFKIHDWTILLLPEDASKQLPSRGQTMIKGTINGFTFETPLEPDGNWSHYFKISKDLQKNAGVKPGVTATLDIEPTKEWPEPVVPEDLRKALAKVPEAQDLFNKITPMARWEWVRWTRSTNSAETRKRRMEVAASKLKSGERRPCCWNRNLSTEPDVSRNGVLLEPTQAAK